MTGQREAQRCIDILKTLKKSGTKKRTRHLPDVTCATLYELLDSNLARRKQDSGVSVEIGGAAAQIELRGVADRRLLDYEHLVQLD